MKQKNSETTRNYNDLSTCHYYHAIESGVGTTTIIVKDHDISNISFKTASGTRLICYPSRHPDFNTYIEKYVRKLIKYNEEDFIKMYTILDKKSKAFEISKNILNDKILNDPAVSDWLKDLTNY